jgi:hypothetical protein
VVEGAVGRVALLEMESVAGFLLGKTVVVGYPVFWPRRFERGIETLSVFIQGNEAGNCAGRESGRDSRPVDGYPFRGGFLVWYVVLRTR